jgi:hypothetical protein
VLRDLELAVRQLSKRRGVTAPALLSLALGIGANTAVFSRVNGVLLRSLPVRNPQELVLLRTILSLLSFLLPARSRSRIDPVVALRPE